MCIDQPARSRTGIMVDHLIGGAPPRLRASGLCTYRLGPIWSASGVEDVGCRSSNTWMNKTASGRSSFLHPHDSEDNKLPLPGVLGSQGLQEIWKSVGDTVSINVQHP